MDPRRNHGACNVLQFMFIYGGINEIGKLFDDIWVFNIEVGNWTQLTLNQKLLKSSHSSMTPVLSNLKQRILDFYSKKIFEGPKVSAI